MVLTEGELLSQSLQSTKLPSDWQQGLVVEVKNIGLLAVKEYLLEFEDLFVDFELRFDAIADDVEENWIWVVLDAANQYIFELSSGLGISPYGQRLHEDIHNVSLTVQCMYMV